MLIADCFIKTLAMTVKVYYFEMFQYEGIVNLLILIKKVSLPITI